MFLLAENRPSIWLHRSSARTFSAIVFAITARSVEVDLMEGWETADDFCHSYGERVLLDLLDDFEQGIALQLSNPAFRPAPLADSKDCAKFVTPFELQK